MLRICRGSLAALLAGCALAFVAAPSRADEFEQQYHRACDPKCPELVAPPQPEQQSQGAQQPNPVQQENVIVNVPGPGRPSAGTTGTFKPNPALYDIEHLAPPKAPQRAASTPSVQSVPGPSPMRSDSEIETSPQRDSEIEDIPIDPEVVRLVESSPTFAGPPPINIATYRLHSSWRSSGAGGPTSSTQNQQTTIRVLRSGLVEFEDVSEGPTRTPAGSMSSTVRTTSISGAGGFFYLGSKTVVRNRFGKTTTRSKLISIDNMSGKMFPVQVGNRFSYDTVTRYDTAAPGYHGSNTYKTKNNCEVTRRFDASSFHSALTGFAYLTRCDFDTTYKGQPSANSRSESNSVFFDALGTWLSADPIDGQRKIIMDGVTSVTGKYRSVMNGSYRLESFSSAR
jgi:hypothetical protein